MAELCPSAMPRFSHAILIILVLSLGIATLYFPFLLLEQRIAALSIAVEKVRSKAKAADEARQRLDKEIRTISKILGDKKSTPPMIDVLLELTNRHSDTSWVRSLEIENGTIMLQGYSMNSDNLLDRLEQSPMFDLISIDGPTISVKGTLYNEYRIKVQLAKRPDP
ncbi:PilN domain-containing protein [Thioflavicoccus mobilis]|nr:PilN domain-containing protein [Thioflavicoccus mobilis]